MMNLWNTFSQHSITVWRRENIHSPLHDKILHDHIVVGIADSSLPEHLQMIKDLITEKVKTLVRQ